MHASAPLVVVMMLAPEFALAAVAVVSDAVGIVDTGAAEGAVVVGAAVGIVVPFEVVDILEIEHHLGSHTDIAHGLERSLFLPLSQILLLWVDDNPLPYGSAVHN